MGVDFVLSAERSGRAGVKWTRPPLDQLLVEHVCDGEKLMYILRGRLQWMASEVGGMG